MAVAVQHYPTHSGIDDVSEDETSDDEMGDHEESFDMEQHNFYHRQQQQALFYQQHQQQHGQSDAAGPSRPSVKKHPQSELEDDDVDYSDDGSSTASIPDENIDYGLTYALYVVLRVVR
jgi:hypothetical protein